MIIDFHTHTFPETIAAPTVDKLSHTAHIHPFSGATESSLKDSMARGGIDLSVILPVATSPRQVEKINDNAARLNEKYEGRTLLSLGCIHPFYEGYRDELKRAASLGLKGIKIHPVYQGTDIDDVRFLRIMDCAASLNLLVVTHAGSDIGYPGVEHCTPAMCRHVADEIGSFPFILAHMGGWRTWEEARELLAETSVFLDTAFSFGDISPLGDGYWEGKDLHMMTEQDFTEFLKLFGAERILFGTDSPWSDQGQAKKWIEDLPVGEEEKSMILGGNARRLLRL